MQKILSTFRQSKLLNALFLSNIYLSFHYYLIIYINSSYLANFFSEGQISTLYIIGSILNIALLLNISRVLNRFGNYRLAIFMTVVELLATLGLVVSTAPFLIGMYFIIHVTAVSVLAFNLDVFLEDSSQDETKTGEVRALYMTLGNITIIICAGAVSLLLLHHTFSLVYTLSFFFLLPFWYYMYKNFRTSVTKPLEHIQMRETLVEYARNKNLYNIFIAQFLLQLFYAFMVVYTPLYLSTVIGFSWSQIGMIFAIMLLPFVLFEIPIGDLADEKYGEKEFLTIGFIIMGIATLCISFITVKSFWIWATILFITRIGASFVEVTSDSYFFKHVDGQKTSLISFYRMTRPLSFIAAPILATLALQFIPFEYTFILIGAIMIIGTHYSLALVDTK